MQARTDDGPVGSDVHEGTPQRGAPHSSTPPSSSQAAKEDDAAVPMDVGACFHHSASSAAITGVIRTQMGHTIILCSIAYRHNYTGNH